jgi:DNA (cytosine-5)-methyltransferase 1
MTTIIEGISLFSGPGGSMTGLKMAGVKNGIGVEWDAAAVTTARAAGHRVHHGDVRDLEPMDFYIESYDGIAHLPGTEVQLLLQASPPCQGLSMAGKGKGREDLDLLFTALDGLIAEAEDGVSTSTLREIFDDLNAMLIADCSDERSPLTFEVVRWFLDLNPDHVMLEQVPAALPIWERIGELLRALGYAVWVDNVQAEQFGVPQTRKRAMLIATRHATEMPAPVPTHSKFHNRTPERLDAGVLPWVSMAEALGWGVTEMVGFPRRYDGQGAAIEIDGELYRERDLREASLPSFVVTEKARSWNRYLDREGNEVTHMGDVRSSHGCVRPIDAPAPTLTASMDNGNFRWIDREAVIAEVEPRVNNQSGTDFDLSWPMDRPAPVVAGRDIITMPGANANRFNGSTKSRNDGIRVTIEEAGILQSFPVDYPWYGTKTKQFQQVGNAVPPVLQHALTSHLLAVCASERSEGISEAEVG